VSENPLKTNDFDPKIAENKELADRRPGTEWEFLPRPGIALKKAAARVTNPRAAGNVVVIRYYFQFRRLRKITGTL
jgi:hypothetical protein